MTLANLKAVSSTDMTVQKPIAAARILVAEDLEMIQELVRSILEKAGHHVDIVANGSEAVAAVKERPYDLVLMDVQMPVMDGTTATRAIRALETPLRHIRIVAMTANLLPHQISSIKLAGVDDHMGKPMKQADLLNKLAKWLPKGDVSGDDI